MQDTLGARYAWMAYAAICIMAVMWTGIQYNCMNLYAAPVVNDLGISRTQFMVVLSIPAVISATVSLLCFGIVEERVGMRRMLLIGGVLNTLAFVSWFFMDSLAMLYLGGVLYGCGCSITAYNSVAAGVNRWFKQRIGSLMGTANAMGNVAGIVFAMVIAALIATVGWRYSFGICVVFSAFSTVACVALYKGNPRDLGVSAMYEDAAASEERIGENAREAVGVPFKVALRMPRLWILAAGYFLLSMTSYGLMSTLPLFAVDLGFGQLQGQVVSASLLAAAVMMVPLGVMCDKLGTKWGLALCGLLTMVAAVLLRLSSLPFVGMLVVAVCSGAAYSACAVTVGTGVKEAFGEVEFSKKLGLCSGCSYIGLALGPALINLAYDSMGTYALALTAFILLTGVMVALFFMGLRKPSV
ncbi:MAG: MFS transporter [Eggerthellaceae bacterium]|nr:MFS transporter [Eggerthellaceae bacterium]